jgi:16S rRNA (guanine966-N2)-methyltransferase
MSRSASKAPARAAQDAFPGKVRVIGGRWRGRRIPVPPLSGLRPSPDRVRETLFNWLQSSIAGARCLDLFAGSGALGLEALSRGAARVVFVDREPAVGRHLEDTLRQFEAGPAAVVHVGDAVRFLEGIPEPFDVVFLDPPFASDLMVRACDHLVAGWLASDAQIYLESPAEIGVPALPAGWAVHRSKRAGQVGYHLLRRSPSS